MVTFSILNKSRMVTAVAGMALFGLTLSGSAMAQDRAMMDRDNNTIDEDFPDPAPLQYPIASPGGRDMYHWRTYRQDTMSLGSVDDARMEHERRMDARRSPIKEDPLMVDPASLEYPIAPPGGMDLYHFESYRGNTLIRGSVTDARWEQERARDARLYRETRFTDDESMADPASLQYPIAPPGGLDLYHWRSYRQDTLSRGSVTDTREQVEKKRDAKFKTDSLRTDNSGQ